MAAGSTLSNLISPPLPFCFSHRNLVLFGLAMCPLKHHTGASWKTAVAKEFQVQVRQKIPESPSAAVLSPPLAGILAGAPREPCGYVDGGLILRLLKAQRSQDPPNDAVEPPDPSAFPTDILCEQIKACLIRFLFLLDKHKFHCKCE